MIVTPNLPQDSASTGVVRLVTRDSTIWSQINDKYWLNDTIIRIFSTFHPFSSKMFRHIPPIQSPQGTGSRPPRPCRCTPILPHHRPRRLPGERTHRPPPQRVSMGAFHGGTPMGDCFSMFISWKTWRSYVIWALPFFQKPRKIALEQKPWEKIYRTGICKN